MLTQNWLSKLFRLLSLRKSLATAGLFCLVFSMAACDLFSRRIFSKVVVRIQFQDHEQGLTLQEFSKLLARKLKDLDPLSAKDPLIVKKFKDRILSDFIVDGLIQVWFAESKLTLDSAAIDIELLAAAKKYPSDSAFRAALAEEDISYDQWADGFKLAAQRRQLFKELQKKIEPVSAADIEAYFSSNKNKFIQKESVLVKSILIADESQSDIIKKLSKKNSIEKLIQGYSIENPKPVDGIYAWIERDTVADFEVFFTHKKSDLIGPIKMNEGLRLFKVTQRKAARPLPIEQVSAQIKTEILSMRETAQFSSWLDEQIKRYTIYKNAEAIDAVVVETHED